MLEDTPRKLLLIMHHYSQHYRRMPDMVELERMSSRLPEPIKRGMKVLVDQHYIEWNPAMPVQTAVLIEGWERAEYPSKTDQAGTRKLSQQINPGNTAYWTHY